MEQHVHYATARDGVGIAYWAMGEGPTLVIPPILSTSHIELEWQIPSRRATYEGLAPGARVVRYDCRGMGQSHRAAPPPPAPPPPDPRQRARHGRRLGPLRPRPLPDNRRLGQLQRPHRGGDL